MKIRLHFLIMCALLMVSKSLVFAGDYLQIQDPQNTWNYAQGTIDTAQLTVKPQGTYLEYGLYLVFSGKDVKDTISQYEIQMFFSLDAKSSLIDAKLWVGDTIVNAKLIDRWSAWKIYEGIVSRRRDPMVIYKNSATAYEMRVYPLKKTTPRKVKITWLQPADFTNTFGKAALPINLMNLSKKIPNLEIYISKDPDWNNPTIEGLKDAQFTNINHPIFGDVSFYTIQSADVKSSSSLVFDSPLQNGAYYKIFPTSYNEGYYQFAYDPRAFVTKQKKLLVLIDYNKLNTNISCDNLLAAIKSAMKTSLKETDSFNIIVSSFDYTPWQNGWVSGSSANIDAAFASENVNNIAQYSLLPNLINAGITFIGDDPKASIVLFSASCNERDYMQANQLCSDLDDRMKKKISFYIGYYANKDVPSTSGPNGEKYWGNEYLFTILAKLSNGTYTNISKTSNNIYNLANTVFNQSNGVFFAFKMFVSATNGLTYSEFTPTNLDDATSQGKSIVQFGRYYGDMPLTINMSGIFEGELFNKVITIDKTDINAAGTQKIWTLNYILSLETKGEINEIVNEIIKTSMDNRILSRYTAFLALEPWMTKQEENDSVAASGNNGNGGTSVDYEIGDNILKIYTNPNPFQINTTITIEMTEPLINQCAIQVYDIMGNCVKSFDLSQSTHSGNRIVLNWNGIDDYGNQLSAGTYLLVVRSPFGAKTVKMILTR
ncbi:MAG TPA: T9SS type A sorting domain-containing protein [Candidatus Kapabacteria bacterium]|nr:T9SS type A sorting domain-containing protein [Candidatus Kapabacteria bacterium]